ncbi:MAG: hypothetical protein H0Z33_16400 [Bacillaceae bacterium]|nr:hypothetical protein [Bacillaceae bacterium]
MWVIHQRLAELWLINKQRPLTEEEEAEFTMCLEANANRAWKLAMLENWSWLAGLADDAEWKERLVSKMEKLDP